MPFSVALNGILVLWMRMENTIGQA